MRETNPPLPTLAQAFESSAETYNVATSVAVDQQRGRVWLTGYFTGTMTCGSTTLVADTDDVNIFVIQQDLRGNIIFAKNCGNAEAGQGAFIIAYRIRVDSGTGDAIVAGSFEQGLDIGTYSFTAVGLTDVFWTRISYRRTVLYAQQFLGSPSTTQNGYGLALEPGTGAVYIAGDFDQSMTIGKPPDAIHLSAPNARDGFLAKIGGVNIDAFSIGQIKASLGAKKQKAKYARPSAAGTDLWSFKGEADLIPVQSDAQDIISANGLIVSLLDADRWVLDTVVFSKDECKFIGGGKMSNKAQKKASKIVCRDWSSHPSAGHVTLGPIYRQTTTVGGRKNGGSKKTHAASLSSKSGTTTTSLIYKVAGALCET